MKVNDDNLKEIENVEDAWTAVLELWKYLSEHDDDLEEHYHLEVKAEVLTLLGYSDMDSGCPMCELGNLSDYKNEPGVYCKGCPIKDDGGCSESPYEDWSLTEYHDKDLALKVYKYLLNLKERLS